MIEPFAQPAWAEDHEKFSADMAAGLARLAHWLRRRAKAKDETPAVTSHRGNGRQPQQGPPAPDARPMSAKTAAPQVGGARKPRGD